MRRLFAVNKKAVFFKNEKHSFLLIFSKVEYHSFEIIDIMIKGSGIEVNIAGESIERIFYLSGAIIICSFITRMAIYGVDSAEYSKFKNDPGIIHKKAMRSAKK